MNQTFSQSQSHHSCGLGQLTTHTPPAHLLTPQPTHAHNQGTPEVRVRARVLNTKANSTSKHWRTECHNNHEPAQSNETYTSTNRVSRTVVVAMAGQQGMNLRPARRPSMQRKTGMDGPGSRDHGVRAAASVNVARLSLSRRLSLRNRTADDGSEAARVKAIGKLSKQVSGI
jgi:hypothetical protein